MTPSWTVLIPVKRLEAAKTRLALPPSPTQDLVLAMLSDVVEAVRADPRVGSTHVITRDRAVARSALALGARTWRASGVRGLNTELAAAESCVPSADGRCIVMPDLATLSADTFGQVLSLAPDDRAGFVPDLAGVGTTMLLAPPGTRIEPRFGSRSAEAHRSVGLEIAESVLPVQARLDVDHVVDLLMATQWGLGARTANWLNRHRKLVDARLGRRADEPGPLTRRARALNSASCN